MGEVFRKGGLIGHENHSQRTHPSENPSNSRVGARVDSAEGSCCAGRDAPLKIRSEFPEFGDGHGEEGPLGNGKNAFATIEGGGACMRVLRQIAPLCSVGLLSRTSANCSLSMRHFALKRKCHRSESAPIDKYGRKSSLSAYSSTRHPHLVHESLTARHLATHHLPIRNFQRIPCFRQINSVFF